MFSKMKSVCDEQASNKPTFKMAIHYIDMVFSLLACIRSVRSANWDLRLSILEDFTKFFFALDLRNYAAMSAWHLADMNNLKQEDPETWTTLASGE